MTLNSGKYVVAKRFIRTLKKKCYKYMTSASQNVHRDKLDDTVNKYSNIYHSTIKMGPVDVKSSTYIKFGIENNDKDPKLDVGDQIRISKYKNSFANGYFPNRSEKLFVIKKVESTVPCY